MKYNPRLKALVIPASELDQAYYLILYTLRHMRLEAKLPLTRYQHDGMLTSHDFAAIALLELGEKLGIDFDVTPHNHNHLDLSEIDGN